MNNKKNKAALFKYGLIVPVLNKTYPDKNKTAYFTRMSKEVKEDHLGEHFKVSITTLRGWLSRYKKDGFDGLINSSRNDKGKFRNLDDDVKSEIIYLKNEYPRIPTTIIYERLIENGTIVKKAVSLSTINRFINKLKQDAGFSVNKDMRRYECQEINTVWCGDSCHGLYINIMGKKTKLYIIAIIDDASRLIVGCDIFTNDNTINLISVIRSAVLKYGKPTVFNFDNGSNYRNLQIQLLSARLGSTLRYCEVNQPTGKAKIERWFRTLRDHFLSNINWREYKTLESIKEPLLEYVTKYNNTPHRSLNGLSPQQRFFSESTLIKRIDEDKADYIFLPEIERTVSNDCVIVIDGIEYEVPYQYAKQRIKLRYNNDLSKVFIFDENTLKPIKILNKHQNALIKRVRIKYSEGE